MIANLESHFSFFVRYNNLADLWYKFQLTLENPDSWHSWQNPFLCRKNWNTRNHTYYKKKLQFEFNLAWFVDSPCSNVYFCGSSTANRPLVMAMATWLLCGMTCESTNPVPTVYASKQRLCMALCTKALR